MDLERQFEAAFSSITLDNGQPLVSVEPEIVHGCVVNNDFAKITLILPDDSPLRGSLPAQVEAEIKKIEQIERVAIEVFRWLYNNFARANDNVQCPNEVDQHWHKQRLFFVF